MPLTVGTRLGPCEVIERIGARSQGEVYRADDQRVDRDGAIETPRSATACSRTSPLHTAALND
jgi:hypothetical protein